MFFFNSIKKNFIFSCAGLCYCTGFSLVVASGSDPPVAVHKLLFALASHCGARAIGFSGCGSWTLEHRIKILVAPRHVGSSQIGD